LKTAVIIGASGQDGRFLYDALRSKGYGVLGLDVDICRSDDVDWRSPVNISNPVEVASLVQAVLPDEVYHLAAFHHSSEDAPSQNTDLFAKSIEVNVSSLVFFLEAMRQHAPASRLFYAASSHVFAGGGSERQDENSPLGPVSMYGISKACGLFICRYYRVQYGLFASTGILFNHESELRSERFISNKIVAGAIRIMQGRQDKLVVGDLDAEVDWGYAPDYVEAMMAVLMTDEPGEFVIASGEKHSVRDFVINVFGFLKLDWQVLVEENKALIKKAPGGLVGDSRKLRELTGWRPSVDFKGLARTMLLKEGVSLDE
jgi:GDPmannose 4,6-dehydratase